MVFYCQGVYDLYLMLISDPYLIFSLISEVFFLKNRGHGFSVYMIREEKIE